MSGLEGFEGLAREFRTAGDNIDKALAPVIRETANKVVETQRQLVPVRTGRTRRSIKATGPNGAPFTARTTEAEVGPTWFVGKFIEFGTAAKPTPRPFVAGSFEPHRADHDRRVMTAMLSNTPGIL